MNIETSHAAIASYTKPSARAPTAQKGAPFTHLDEAEEDEDAQDDLKPVSLTLSISVNDCLTWVSSSDVDGDRWRSSRCLSVLTIGDNRVGSSSVVLIVGDNRAVSDSVVLTAGDERAGSDSAVLTVGDNRAGSDPAVLTVGDNRAVSDSVVLTPGDKRAGSDSAVLTVGYNKAGSDSAVLTVEDNRAGGDSAALTVGDNRAGNDTAVLTMGDNRAVSDFADTSYTTLGLRVAGLYNQRLRRRQDVVWISSDFAGTGATALRLLSAELYNQHSGVVWIQLRDQFTPAGWNYTSKLRGRV